MNARHRTTSQLTLGFLTLGAAPDPLEVVAAAADAGFAAAGLRLSGRHPGEPWPSVDGDPHAFERIRDAAAVRGLRVSSASGYYITPQSQPEHLRANVEAARRVGARLVVQGCFDPDLARVTRLLAGYADAAADAGVRIGLELMPMSELKNLPAALRLIADAGRSNIGLVIDTLHVARAGATAGDLRRLDPRLVYLAQICDAPAQLAPGTSLYDEAMTGRLYPGDGGLDLAGYVQALDADLEIECETPVVRDAGLPLAQRARRTAAAAAAFFGRHFPA